MVQDWNKGIWNITYNHLNLPVKIEFDKYEQKQISYLYNAVGVKLEKTVTDKTVVPEVHQDIHYLGGFQYSGLDLQFFPTGEGYVSVTDGKFKYVYNYTDHLGNIRLSYSRPELNSPLVVMEESHYYPYGMKHSNYAGEKYKYVKQPDGDGFVVLEAVERSNYQNKFNGQEYQDELGLNLYDMDFRDYDPAIGRWIGIDPVIHYSQSAYNAFDGNPVFWADPSGADAVTFTKDSDGEFKMTSYQSDEEFLEELSRIQSFDIDDYIYLNGGSDGNVVLKGGTYNNQKFANIGKEPSFLERVIKGFNMSQVDISKIKIDHVDFVGTDGEYSKLRDNATQQSKYLKLMAGLLGVSDTKILKGELNLKAGVGGILGAYLYLQAMSFSDNVKTINNIKDKYDDIGGNQGVYMIYRESVQGTRTGNILSTTQLDVYDVSTAKFLGKIIHSY